MAITDVSLVGWGSYDTLQESAEQKSITRSTDTVVSDDVNALADADVADALGFFTPEEKMRQESKGHSAGTLLAEEAAFGATPPCHTPGNREWLLRAQHPQDFDASCLPPLGISLKAFTQRLEEHFTSDSSAMDSDETLVAQINQALDDIPNDRFISPRWLQQIDAVIASAFKKNVFLMPKLSSLLLDSTNRLYDNRHISKATCTFLQKAASLLTHSSAAPPSLVKMLVEEYDE